MGAACKAKEVGALLRGVMDPLKVQGLGFRDQGLGFRV